ncbi:hypothetical protein LAZ40_07145 [Cereibacter sphaeroides]|uniref:hypothetical protein n=1 Tax=Cereibacter sphaeroides TaxID=1063 RepID=UPI001F43B2BC|nr:hypothetical protein [Cereibacter sphaeroides]MCE6958823.1 hypothetical protein [Cereibacter sphaeroides]MCE6973303.1 hypothetical protein [Cereibacter sphaeroides]
MPDPMTFIRRQLLLHFVGQRPLYLEDLARMLLGRNGRPRDIQDLLDGLIEEGALVRGAGTIHRAGPRYEEIMSAAAPGDALLTAEDLAAWESKRSIRSLSIGAPLGPVDAALLDALERKRRAGGLQLFPQDVAERVVLADRWNEYLDTGRMSSRLLMVLRKTLGSFAMEALPEASGAFADTHRAALADALNDAIARGTFETDRGLLIDPVATVIDRRTGRELAVAIENWQVKFYTCLAEHDYDYRPFLEGEAWPDVVHLELETDGSLILFGGRGGKGIPELVQRAFVDEIGIDDDFNADTGAHELSLASFRETGILDVSLGDVFPNIRLDRAAGRLDLVPFGQVVSAEEARELALEENEDFAAGYFLVERDGVEVVDTVSLEWLKIASEAQLVRFLATRPGIDEARAREMIAQETVGDDRTLFRLEDAPDRLHVYLPFGRNVEGFGRAMQGSGHQDFLLPGQDSVVAICREPLEFPGFRVRDLDVAPPASERDSAPAV